MLLKGAPTLQQLYCDMPADVSLMVRSVAMDEAFPFCLPAVEQQEEQTSERRTRRRTRRRRTKGEKEKEKRKERGGEEGRRREQTFKRRCAGLVSTLWSLHKPVNG